MQREAWKPVLTSTAAFLLKRQLTTFGWAPLAGRRPPTHPTELRRQEVTGSSLAGRLHSEMQRAVIGD